jgi:medium-chain acyl-[acyl-carrier-protein] hydrolase
VLYLKMPSQREISVWLPNYKPHSTATLRLFCFPYAGGNSFIFRNWQAKLPPSVEVCPVQLPGRATRLKETPCRQIKPLVEAIAGAISHALDKPFAFFGHSMGALISFELARHLRRERLPQPVHLFVSGSHAPQLPDRDPPFHDMPEPEFIEELRRLNGTPDELFKHPEMIQLIVPLLRADFSVCQTYVYAPEPPLDCPITAYGGATDSENGDDRLRAWREQTTAFFRAQFFPGDHFFINTEQEQVLRTFSQDLMKVEQAVR